MSAASAPFPRAKRAPGQTFDGTRSQGVEEVGRQSLPYKKLAVWQRAMELAPLIYRLSERFPRSEMFGLTSQIQRASVSIAANIAEGQARNSSGAFAFHLNIALGSLAEVDTLLDLAIRLGYLERRELGPTVGCMAEVRRLLNGLVRRLRNEGAASR
ncbi:MAG: four helix bundle protein [Vulcanimicrobiota bacterium]